MCNLWRVQMIGYIMTCWSCLFVFTLHSLSLIISIFHCYHVDLSQGIELLKCLSGNIYCSVFLRLSQLSQLSIIQLMGLCVFRLANSLVMIMEMCTVLLSSSEVGIMNHCLGLGHETMVRVVCLIMFLSLQLSGNCDIISNRLWRHQQNVNSVSVVAINTLACCLVCWDPTPPLHDIDLSV